MGIFQRQRSEPSITQESIAPAVDALLHLLIVRPPGDTLRISRNFPLHKFLGDNGFFFDSRLLSEEQVIAHFRGLCGLPPGGCDDTGDIPLADGRVVHCTFETEGDEIAVTLTLIPAGR